jgi:signal transduction histidine kinase
MAAIFIIRSLRAFQVENQLQLNALRESQQAERQRLEELSAELLHRTVTAQEAERQRIASELHDGTGQTLTALALGLRGLRSTIDDNPPRAIEQAARLETLATNGLDELGHMVTDLHPPQLDDLGLMAALRWYAGEIKARYGLQVNVASLSNDNEIPPNLRVVLFRIAQEAITNVVRHANANQIELCLSTTQNQVMLLVMDDGQGFNVKSTLQASKERPCWGLLGMMERASLVGGSCEISSEPGNGTRIEVKVEIPQEVA